MQAHPRWKGQSGEFRQNVVHWSREWQTSPCHEQHEKAKRNDQKMNPSSQKVSNVLLGKSRGQLLIVPERMKWLGRNGNDAQL